MAWIESHQSIGAHPKTRKLARRLDCSIPTAVGHLHLLWHWAVDYAPDGELARHDAEDIAIAAQWEGDPDEFLKALIEAEWVDHGDTGERIHDWMEFAGKLIEARAAGARGNHKRWHVNKGVTDPSCPFCSGDSGATVGGDSTGPVQPDPTQQDPTDPDRARDPSPTEGSLVLRLNEACEHRTAGALAEARGIIKSAARLLDLGEVERIVTWAERRDPAPTRPRIIWKPVRQRAIELGCNGVPESWDGAS